MFPYAFSLAVFSKLVLPSVQSKPGLPELFSKGPLSKKWAACNSLSMTSVAACIIASYEMLGVFIRFKMVLQWVGWF